MRSTTGAYVFVWSVTYFCQVRFNPVSHTQGGIPFPHPACYSFLWLPDMNLANLRKCVLQGFSSVRYTQDENLISCRKVKNLSFNLGLIVFMPLQICPFWKLSLQICWNRKYVTTYVLYALIPLWTKLPLCSTSVPSSISLSLSKYRQRDWRRWKVGAAAAWWLDPPRHTAHRRTHLWGLRIWWVGRLCEHIVVAEVHVCPPLPPPGHGQIDILSSAPTKSQRTAKTPPKIKPSAQYALKQTSTKNKTGR